MIVLLVNPLFARQELAPNPFSLTFPNYCSKQQLVAWTLIVQGHWLVAAGGRTQGNWFQWGTFKSGGFIEMVRIFLMGRDNGTWNVIAALLQRGQWQGISSQPVLQKQTSHLDIEGVCWAPFLVATSTVALGINQCLHLHLDHLGNLVKGTSLRSITESEPLGVGAREPAPWQVLEVRTTALAL